MTTDETRYHPCDVLVAGGGMAGIAAAIASARAGARTILVEQAGWLGGQGVTGATGLHSFFNVFDAHPGAERMRVVAGIAQELVDRVQTMGGGLGHVRMERGGDFVSMLTPVEPEVCKLAAARMCLEAGVRLLLHTVRRRGAPQAPGTSAGWWSGTRPAAACCRRSSISIALATATSPPMPGPSARPSRRTIRAPTRPGSPSGSATSIWPRWRPTSIDGACITQLAHAVKPGMQRPDLVRLGISICEAERADR